MFHRLALTIGCFLILAGCGDIEWLPDGPNKRIDAGGFVSSRRQGPGEKFITVTQRGAFHTYTSLQLPAGTPVVLERSFAKGAIATQILLALDQALLVADVIVLAE